jgi:hypothetical protein
MRKLLLIILLVISLATQAVAGSDKSIGDKCYKSHHKEGGNQVVACIYTQCQQKYQNQIITFQIQCQMAANKEFQDLLSKNKGK